MERVTGIGGSPGWSGGSADRCRLLVEAVDEQAYVVAVIMRWIERELRRLPHDSCRAPLPPSTHRRPGMSSDAALL